MLRLADLVERVTREEVLPVVHVVASDVVPHESALPEHDLKVEHHSVRRDEPAQLLHLQQSALHRKLARPARLRVLRLSQKRRGLVPMRVTVLREMTVLVVVLFDGLKYAHESVTAELYHVASVLVNEQNRSFEESRYRLRQDLRALSSDASELMGSGLIFLL